MLGSSAECHLLTRKTRLACLLANCSTVESVTAHNMVCASIGSLAAEQTALHVLVAWTPAQAKRHC